jgi:hypothetical protein
MAAACSSTTTVTSETKRIDTIDEISLVGGKFVRSDSSKIELEREKAELATKLWKTRKEMSKVDFEWLWRKIDMHGELDENDRSALFALAERFDIDEKLLAEAIAMVMYVTAVDSQPYAVTADRGEKYAAHMDALTFNWLEKRDSEEGCYRAPSGALQYSWISPFADSRLKVSYIPEEGIVTSWASSDSSQSTRIHNMCTGLDFASPLTWFKFHSEPRQPVADVTETKAPSDVTNLSLDWIVCTVAVSIEQLVKLVQRLYLSKKTETSPVPLAPLGVLVKLYQMPIRRMEVKELLHMIRTEASEKLHGDEKGHGTSEVIDLVSRTLLEIQEIEESLPGDTKAADLAVTKFVKMFGSWDISTLGLMQQLTTELSCDPMNNHDDDVKIDVKIIFAKELILRKGVYMWRPVVFSDRRYVIVQMKLSSSSSSWREVKIDESSHSLKYGDTVHYEHDTAVDLYRTDGILLTTITTTLGALTDAL